MRALNPNVRGVFFQIRNIHNIPLEVTNLFRIFGDVGITATFYSNPDLKADADYALTVGLKC
jgi:hypothetical protein